MPATTIDHEAIAASLLTDKYKRPLLQALARALASGFQTADDVAVRLPEETLGLDSATGVQLGLLADLVGAPVFGDEATTRVLVKTWLRHNRSRGTVEDLIETTALVVQDFIVQEIFPANVVITVFELALELALVLALVLSGTRAAGVGGQLVASAVPKSATFQYSATGATYTDTNIGYGFGQYAAGIGL